MSHSKKIFIEKKLSEFLSRYGQIMLIGMVMIVFVLMVLPLEPELLDGLLAVNITGTLVILMMAITISHPMKMYSFPSLLLIFTLFRLGLNISSTRLILSRGDAGDIIKTFGYFVTEGNLVVGVVIFVLLLIIQFLVVSKGAERVAEVAARFTLDALPGKQMSIDADLRAGMITSDAAAKRRTELIKESKLYGSMDGAMKFVKGDTIAGFVITFINILGGLIIGVFQSGMDIGIAAEHYSILTIGDGLVTQIPALLISISAGFIVTRVSDETNEQSLGSEIGAQILVNPKTLLIVSGFLLLMGLIPGFPFVFFLVVSSVVTLLAVLVLWRKKTLERELDSIAVHCVDSEECQAELGYVQPLLLELGPQMYECFLQDDQWRHCFNDLFPKLKTGLTERLGVPIPDIKLKINDTLPKDQYRIKIYELPIDQGVLSLVAPKISPVEFLLKHLGRLLVKHASEFIGMQEVRDILSNVEKYHPELVREVVPRLLTVQKLTDVVKRLVDEGISIKDFRVILETLSVVKPEDKNPVDLTELIRMGLKRQITYRYAGSVGKLSCFCLDPEIEDEVGQNVSRNGSECFLRLSPDRMATINNAIKGTYHNHGVNQKNTVILTQAEIRRYVRKMIEHEMPDVAVLSYQELEPHVIIDQRDTIATNCREMMVG